MAIVKVFLVDTAHLGDLPRATLFLVLGATLLVVGYLYSRFVFSPPATKP